MVLAVVVVKLEDCCQRHVALLHNLTGKKWYSDVYACTRTQTIIIVPGAPVGVGGCTCEVLMSVNSCTARTKKYKNVHKQPAAIIAGASFGGSGDCEGLNFASVIVINPSI